MLNLFFGVLVRLGLFLLSFHTPFVCNVRLRLPLDVLYSLYHSRLHSACSLPGSLPGFVLCLVEKPGRERVLCLFSAWSGVGQRLQPASSAGTRLNASSTGTRLKQQGRTDSTRQVGQSQGGSGKEKGKGKEPGAWIGDGRRGPERGKILGREI